MLFILSPAKSLDFETPAPAGLAHTAHPFRKQSLVLIHLLRDKSPVEVAELMDLSEALAQLNVERYQAYSSRVTPKNAKQALLAFNGDVYDGLSAKTLNEADLHWAQAHVRMLSGLYGVLRPLDLMQPYRLEMGTRLANEHGANLYKFWGARLANHLDAEFALLNAAKAPVIVNLASQEYFKAVDRKALKARVVECVFEEERAGSYKVISFMAKRARGSFARFAIQHRITSVSKLKSFDADGYGFAADVSTPDRLVFRRGAA